MPDGHWSDFAVAAAGALVLNATLPLEIAWVYRAVGIDFAPGWLGMWLMAVSISVVISAVVTAVSWRRPALPEAAAPAPLRGLALKADLSRLHAVTSEDHYLRLHMDGGEKPLLLYRFGDALADLDGLDGLQVHRGAWVAARAVTAAEREGRRWWLRLPDGTRLPVSDRHLPAVRARGWLAR
jgi:DNA-binding LytR/AlgR family response regulator